MIVFLCVCLYSQGDQLKAFHQVAKNISLTSSDKQYLLIRHLFNEFYQCSERPVIYHVMFLSTISGLLNRNDLSDSLRLEICHGLRKQPRLALPVLSALEAYQNDLQARNKVIQQGINDGTGKSSLIFVKETISVIKSFQPKAK